MKFIILTLFLLFCCCESRISQSHCGQRAITGGLINNGEPAKRGMWPWLGVWCFGDTTAKCFCGASLVTKQHVVTAAHCLHPKEHRIGTFWSDTSLHFGRFDLTNFDEEEISQVRRVIDVAINEVWDHREEKYDSDIAVLRFDERVRLNSFIQLVCLPTIDESFGGSSNGTVVSKKLLSVAHSMNFDFNFNQGWLGHL